MFEQQEFGRYFFDILITARALVIISALIAFLAATAPTRFRFGFRTPLPIMFLVARTAPPAEIDGASRAPFPGQRRLVSGLGGAVKD